jgi:coxsackievirus/adenovirus receptor
MVSYLNCGDIVEVILTSIFCYVITVERFLGNQLLSYGQNLTLNFRVDRRDTRLSAEDVVLEGAGLRVAVPLIAQGNAYPGENMQTFVFRCVEIIQT